jgi:hypothetical protein
MVTRYFVNGKGYNSEAAAMIALGGNVVRCMRWDASRKAFPSNDYSEDRRREVKDFERQWMRDRYPCVCKTGCHMGGNNGYGCLTARMRDYKQLGLLLTTDQIDYRGNPVAIKALPERVA